MRPALAVYTHLYSAHKARKTGHLLVYVCDDSTHCSPFPGLSPTSDLSVWDRGEAVGAHKICFELFIEV